MGREGGLGQLICKLSQNLRFHTISACSADGIDWKFIPPRTLHCCGLWEAAVMSAKFHFYRVVGASILATYEL